MNSKPIVYSFFVFVAFCFSGRGLVAQKIEWTVIRCAPAMETVQSSDVRLFPDHSKMTDSNAVPTILRLWAEVPANFWAKIGFARQDERLKQPLDAFRESDLTIGMRYDDFRIAAYSAKTDWARGIYQNDKLADVLLPDVQQGRLLMYALACNIRSNIANNQLDRALEQMEWAMGVCHHLQETPFFVVKLVAAAEMRMYLNQIDELIALENCPNLYWALSRLPNDLLSLDRVIDFESLASTQFELGVESMDLEELTDDQKEAVERALEQTDQSHRWFFHPPHIAIPKLFELEQEIEKRREDGEEWVGDSNLRLYVALHVVERQIAILQAVEAIRAYVAANDGKLPESLDEVVDTPVPVDPFSNQPFRYQFKNNTAMLLTSKLDGVDDAEFGFRYRIEFSEKPN